MDGHRDAATAAGAMRQVGGRIERVVGCVGWVDVAIDILTPEKSVHGVREGNGNVLARVDSTARTQGNETSEAVRHVEELLVCVIWGMCWSSDTIVVRVEGSRAGKFRGRLFRGGAGS